MFVLVAGGAALGVTAATGTSDAAATGRWVSRAWLCTALNLCRQLSPDIRSNKKETTENATHSFQSGELQFGQLLSMAAN
jgi:hypothetical protein